MTTFGECVRLGHGGEAEGEGEFARGRRGDAEVECVGRLVPIEFGGGTKELDVGDAEAFGLLGRAERVDDEVAVSGPGHGNRVDRSSLLCETKILGSVGRSFLVVESAPFDLGRAFAEDEPGSGVIDGFAVLLEPSADFEKRVANGIGNGAIGAWADVEKKVAVLADDVHELVNDKVGGFEVVVREVHVTPGNVADGSVGLPVVRLDAFFHAALEIASAGVPLESVILDINDAGKAVFCGVVVVEGGETRDIGTIVGLANPPIEIHDVGFVFLDDFRGASEPVVGIFGADVGPIVHKDIGLFLEPVVSGAVEGGELRIVDVGAEGAAAVEEPIVFGTMKGSAEMEAFGTNGDGELADNVTMRTHLGGGPVGDVGGVHGEAVVMLSDGDDVASASVFEELGPFLRIPFGGGEERDEILVAEFVLGAEALNVFGEGGIFLLIHVAGIPLVLRAGNGIDAPMNEDAEFGILIPLRHLEAAQGIPVGAKGAVIGLSVEGMENGGARSIVFGDGGLPFMINFDGGFGGGRGSERVGGLGAGQRSENESEKKDSY